MTSFFDSGLINVATHMNDKAIKRAFVPAAGLDPAAAGGMPPQDPAMMGGAPPPGGMPPGGDPMAGGMPPGGGAPPMDPAMMGGAPPPPGGGMLPPELQSAVDTAVQAAMGAGGGAGAGAAAGGIKPKIDVNVEIMQMKKMLAKVVDSLGVQIPAQEMVATPEDLDSMAAGNGEEMGGNPAGAGAIAPPNPMGGMPDAAPEAKAAAFEDMGGRASALRNLLVRARVA